LGEVKAYLAQGKFDGKHVELKGRVDEVKLIHKTVFICLINGTD